MRDTVKHHKLKHIVLKQTRATSHCFSSAGFISKKWIGNLKEYIGIGWNSLICEFKMIKQSPLWCADGYIWYMCNTAGTYFSTISQMFLNNCIGVSLLCRDHTGVRMQI